MSSNFIKTETDPAGGTNYTISGTSQLLSVPYAMYSNTAETAGDAVKLSGNQTIEGNKTFNGTTTIATPVNATDAANKAYVDDVLKKLGLVPNNYSGTITDIDGNTYMTVKIDKQIWMAENLKTTRFNDGTAIPLVTDSAEWGNDGPTYGPRYCWYNNDTTYKNIYGALYCWPAAGTGKLCPTGWHVPEPAEWTTIINYLGGQNVAGGKLKESGTTHWKSPNTGATNESGFTALPGGFRQFYGPFSFIGLKGYWWSSVHYMENAYDMDLNYDSGYTERDRDVMGCGISVRCVKD